MRLGVFSDGHVGNHSAASFGGGGVGRVDRRCRMTLDVHDAMVTRAIQERVEVLVSGGDLLDTDHPPPDHLHELMQIFRRAKAAGIEVHLVLGNHEEHSSMVNDHALAPFKGEFVVHDVPGFISQRLPRVFAVPYGYNPLDLNPEADVVVAHHGISEHSTHPGKAAGAWVIRVEALRAWMARTGVKTYLAGDWHEHRAWPEHGIWQVGALAPVNWTNRSYAPGLHDPYGSLIVVDLSSVRRIVIPGPRFLRAPSLSEVDALVRAASAEGNLAFVEVSGGEEIPPEMRGTVRSGRALGQHRDELLRAAEGVVSAAHDDDEVRAYVGASPKIPEHMRERVAEIVVEALKEARCQT